MIIDCFPFFNEFDILKIRFEELYDVVDYFVIVEADHTHTGKPKPWNFEENKFRYSQYASKIISIYDWGKIKEFFHNQPERSKREEI